MKVKINVFQQFLENSAWMCRSGKQFHALATYYPLSIEGGDYHSPLRFLPPGKTLVSATKWLLLILRSSFAVILAKQNDSPKQKATK